MTTTPPQLRWGGGATDLPARSRSGFASAKAGWRAPSNDFRSDCAGARERLTIALKMQSANVPGESLLCYYWFRWHDRETSAPSRRCVAYKGFSGGAICFKLVSPGEL